MTTHEERAPGCPNTLDQRTDPRRRRELRGAAEGQVQEASLWGPVRDVGELRLSGEDLGQAGGVGGTQPLVQRLTGDAEPQHEGPASLLRDSRRHVHNGPG
jgi:hypothetical protein